MAAEVITLVLKPAIVCGLLLGGYEAITLMKDVQVPQGKFMHALTALTYALIAVFASFNVEYVLSVIPFLKTIPFLSNPMVFRIAIGAITAIKVHAVSRATKSSMGLSGLSETWFHTFFIGILVGAAPYVWAILMPALPVFLK